jgi:hypothetical protein
MASKKSESLAEGQQKGGVWRKDQRHYYVRILVDGKRKYIAAGDDCQAAKLLAQEAKTRRAKERMTGRNDLVKDLFKQKSNLTFGELVRRYIDTRRPLLKPLTVRF